MFCAPQQLTGQCTREMCVNGYFDFKFTLIQMELYAQSGRIVRLFEGRSTTPYYASSQVTAPKINNRAVND